MECVTVVCVHEKDDGVLSEHFISVTIILFSTSHLDRLAIMKSSCEMLIDKYAGKFKHVSLTIKLLCLDVHIHKLFISSHTQEKLVPVVCLFF